MSKEIMTLGELTYDGKTVDILRSSTLAEDVKKNATLTSSLVYELTDEGYAACKKDAALMRKYAKSVRDAVKTAFNDETAGLKAVMGEVIKYVQVIEDNAASGQNAFAERLAKLQEERTVAINEAMENLWESAAVRPEFRKGNADHLAKLASSFTDKGKISKPARDAIVNIVSEYLGKQRQHDTRIMYIENQCLKNGINPAFTHQMLGDEFLADDAAFNAKLELLIDSEMKRQKEIEERIIRQQEEQKARDIAAAEREAAAKKELEMKAIMDEENAKKEAEAQQRAIEIQAIADKERERVANEHAEQLAQNRALLEMAQREIQDSRVTRHDTKGPVSFESIVSKMDIKKPENATKPVDAVQGRHGVKVVVSFLIPNVATNISLGLVGERVKSKLPEDLMNKLIDCVAYVDE